MPSPEAVPTIPSTSPSQTAPPAAPAAAKEFVDLGIRNRTDLDIIAKTENYLQLTQDLYQRGQPEYYIRNSLLQALQSFRDGNYGIGAIAVLVRGNDIYEFQGNNRMITGVSPTDHAETRALTKLVAFERMLDGRPGALDEVELRRIEPDQIYRKDSNPFTAGLKEGVHIYGTLEPCPMCTCVAINSKALVSISGSIDELGAPHDEGKTFAMPAVWKFLKDRLGLKFETLRGRDSKDQDLIYLSGQIFLETREGVDSRLISGATSKREP